MNHARRGTPLAAMAVSKLVTKIGEKARIIVNPTDGKTASAHDLRRTFASRWARKVAPAVLQKLMRHARIDTTMGFYVDLDVDEMADDLWANHPTAQSNTSGNIGPIDAPALTEGTDANTDK